MGVFLGKQFSKLQVRQLSLCIRGILSNLEIFSPILDFDFNLLHLMQKISGHCAVVNRFSSLVTLL